jgi:hypothetical protein
LPLALEPEAPAAAATLRALKPASSVNAWWCDQASMSWSPLPKESPGRTAFVEAATACTAYTHTEHPGDDIDPDEQRAFAERARLRGTLMARHAVELAIRANPRARATILAALR